MIFFFFFFFFLIIFLHFFRLKPLFFRGFVVFRFELCRLIARKKTVLLEKIGYFNSDISFRFLSLNTLRFGFWFNKGAFLKNSLKFVKYLIHFLVKF